MSKNQVILCLSVALITMSLMIVGGVAVVSVYVIDAYATSIESRE